MEYDTVECIKGYFVRHGRFRIEDLPHILTCFNLADSFREYYANTEELIRGIENNFEFNSDIIKNELILFLRINTDAVNRYISAPSVYTNTDDDFAFAPPPQNIFPLQIQALPQIPTSSPPRRVNKYPELPPKRTKGGRSYSTMKKRRRNYKKTRRHKKIRRHKKNYTRTYK